MKAILLLLLLSLTFNTHANTETDFNENLKLAQQGQALAQFNLGVKYAFGHGTPQNHKEAIKWYLKAAEQGHAESQFLIGDYYESGKNVPQNYKEAAKWYLKAAEQGHVVAQIYTAKLLFIEDVVQNNILAAKWLLKAAEQGHAEAQYILAIMYIEGIGVTPNNKKAYIWNSLAATQGEKKAIELRDILAKKLSPSILDEAQEEASKLYEKINGAG